MVGGGGGGGGCFGSTLVFSSTYQVEQAITRHNFVPAWEVSETVVGCTLHQQVQREGHGMQHIHWGYTSLKTWTEREPKNNNKKQNKNKKLSRIQETLVII